MDRAVPALLAALLVLSSVGAVVGVSPPGTGDEQAVGTVDGVSANTSKVLVLEPLEQSAFAHADLVVTGTIDAETESLLEAQARYRLREALDEASTASAERAVIRNATIAAERRTDALVATERSARQGLIAGEVTPEAYLATLGRVHATAIALETTVDTIGSLDEHGVETNRRAQVLARLSMLQGPVRADLATAIRGDGPSGRIFVGTTEYGVTLATIEDGEYQRETVRLDHRDDQVGRLTFDEAETRFAESYPWTSENKQRISMGAVGPDVYVVEYTHGHGTVDASLDASTGSIFREAQTKSLGSLPVEEQTWADEENLSVGISNTYPGGPLRVNVTNGSGAPVPADVSVNGTAVGDTDANGVVWTVSPAEPYPVMVNTANATLQVTVDPTTGELAPSKLGTGNSS